MVAPHCERASGSSQASAQASKYEPLTWALPLLWGLKYGPPRIQASPASVSTCFATWFGTPLTAHPKTV